MEKIIFLKGRESIIVGPIVLVTILILAIPVLIILFLRFLFKYFAAIREQTKVPEQITYNLERIY